MLKLEKITKKYRNHYIFEAADFVANPSEITLLIGESGIGKTTLLEIIAGLKSINSGTLTYKDQLLPIDDDEEMSRFRSEKIGYIVQDFALIEDYTVMDNLCLPFFYKNRDRKKVVDREEIMQQAAALSIDSLLDKRVKDISGGQKQRVAILRSLLTDPEIILADEPTSNLDEENFNAVLSLLKSCREKNKIVIVSTHDVRLRELADRVYRVKDYRLVEEV